jgi:hypothetical protein
LAVRNVFNRRAGRHAPPPEKERTNACVRLISRVSRSLVARRASRQAGRPSFLLGPARSRVRKLGLRYKNRATNTVRAVGLLRSRTFGVPKPRGVQSGPMGMDFTCHQSRTKLRGCATLLRRLADSGHELSPLAGFISQISCRAIGAGWCVAIQFPKQIRHGLIAWG